MTNTPTTDRQALRKIPVAGQRVFLAGIDALCQKSANGSLTFLSWNEEFIDEHTTPVENIYFIATTGRKDKYDYLNRNQIATKTFYPQTIEYYQASRMLRRGRN